MLEVQLWDADKFSGDDPLGQVEIRVADMAASPKVLSLAIPETSNTLQHPGSTMLGACRYECLRTLNVHAGQRAYCMLLLLLLLQARAAVG